MVHAYCAVFRCPSSSRKHKEIKFHKFPRDPNRREAWIDAARRPELKCKTVNQVCNMHVCSLHFEPFMYGMNQLKDTAIPTANLPSASTFSVLTQTEPQLGEIKEELTSNKYDTTTSIVKIKFEVEDNESEVIVGKTPDLPNHSPKRIKFDNLLESEKKDRIEIGSVTIEQFLKGCELYLSPELNQYVKTQIRIP